MNRVLATVALTLAVGAPGIAYADSADAAFAAELKTGPCFAKPAIDDVTGVRMALIAMGMSIERIRAGRIKKPGARARAPDATDAKTAIDAASLVKTAAAVYIQDGTRQIRRFW